MVVGADVGALVVVGVDGADVWLLGTHAQASPPGADDKPALNQ